MEADQFSGPDAAEPGREASPSLQPTPSDEEGGGEDVNSGGPGPSAERSDERLDSAPHQDTEDEEALRDAGSAEHVRRLLAT